MSGQYLHLQLALELPMKRLDEFRLYYNHTIHPELLRQDKKRRRLLRLLFFSSIILLGLLLLEFYLDAFVLSLLLLIPIGLYISFLLYRVRNFVAQFKPKVINLLLDFLDDGLNYGTMSYNAKKYISKQRFLSSLIFSGNATFYNGEDYIKGKVGEISFEMSELTVKDYSKVRNRLDTIFEGIFMHATFNKHMKGSVVIIPDQFRQYLTRSIKAFNKKGGRDVRKGQLRKDFDEIFDCFANRDAKVVNLLSDEMQKTILDYHNRTGKDFFISFVNRDIYIGVTEPKDILEPYIFKSNVSYDLIREFYEDISLLIRLVEDFDENN